MIDKGDDKVLTVLSDTAAVEGRDPTLSKKLSSKTGFTQSGQQRLITNDQAQAPELHAPCSKPQGRIAIGKECRL